MNPYLYGRLRRIICPFESIIEELPEEGRLLDIGSGYGTFCLLAAERTSLSITGLELEEGRVRAANLQAAKEGKKGKVKFIAKDVSERFKGRFDVVTCVDVFHHIDKRLHGKLLAEIRKSLVKSGRFIVKEMDTKPLHKYLWNMAHDVAMTRSVKMHYMPKERFAQVLEDSGFRVERMRDLSNPLYAHYLISARKA